MFYYNSFIDEILDNLYELKWPILPNYESPEYLEDYDLEDYKDYNNED